MTKQVRENVYYLSQRLSFIKAPHLPKNDSRVVYIESPEKDITDVFNTTMCRRRYIGTWEIKEDKLYLLHIEGYYQLTKSESILAEWYTGNLIIAIKDEDNDRKELQLKVDKGMISDCRMSTYEGFIGYIEM